MKKNIVLIMSILFTCFIQSKAQTNVSGTLPGNTTWDLSGSPYIITGDVNPEPGKYTFYFTVGRSKV